jgi:protein SEY1
MIGIWLSPAKKDSILILDVEGVDGSERDQDTEMERKTTLFSLAIAEVVLINIWANQVNNRSGPNMALIEMVMQQVVALFGERTR